MLSKMHLRVVKFHIWIAHGEIVDPFRFLVPVSAVMPLLKK